MKKIYILMTVLLGILSFNTANAEVNAGVGVRASSTVRMEIKGERADFRGEIKAFASSTREDIEKKKLEMRNNASTTRAVIKTEIENRKQELETKRKEIKGEMKVNIASKLGELAKFAVRRLTENLGRLTEIKTKIETRLAKIDTNGGNTTVARTDLAQAQIKLDAAQTSITIVSSMQVGTTTDGTTVKNIREAVKTAESAIKDAKEALSKVVRDMKGIKVNANASTTVENN